MSTEAMKLALEALEVATTPLAKDRQEVLRAITALREALAEQPAQQEPVAGCVCRWNSEGDRVVTCERHQGWLEVIAEWADRAREAEKKLKFLMNTSPPAQPQPEPVAWIPIITWRWNNNAGTWEGLTNTAPPARKPLTDEEIEEMMNDLEEGYSLYRSFARAIEAAHGITATREHVTDDSQCWCNPEITYTDPDTGVSVIVHKEPQ